MKAAEVQKRIDDERDELAYARETGDVDHIEYVRGKLTAYLYIMQKLESEEREEREKESQ